MGAGQEQLPEEAMTGLNLIVLGAWRDGRTDTSAQEQKSWGVAAMV